MEFLSDPEMLKTLIPTTVGLIVTAIASLVIGVYLERFKGRTIILKRKITSQPIAFASEDDYWGQIRVMYNDYEARNLNLFTIEIHNSSNKDLENLVIDFNVDAESMILAGDGKVEETETPLLLSKAYSEIYEDVAWRNQEDQEEHRKNEDHIIGSVN